MNKTLIIIQREFMTRVGKKSFILLTVLMPFIFAALIFVPVWLAGIKDGEQKTVVVVDKTGRYAGLFRDDASYRFVPAAAVTPDLRSDTSEVEAVIAITADLATHPAAVAIYSRTEVPSDLSSLAENVLSEQVRRDKLAAYNVQGLERIIDDVQGAAVDVRTVKWDETGRETASDTDLATVAGLLFTMLIYFFVLAYGGMVMQSVMEEKTNRIVELMVSSVKPFQLMMGKIVGVALVGFVQLIIWAGMVAAILGVCWHLFGLDPATAQEGAALTAANPAMTEAATDGSGEMMAALMNLPFAELGIMFVLYFVGGYLLYASFFAAVGASINAQEDSSQFIMPTTVVMIFGLYAGIYGAENPDGPLAFWSSMFPLTSPIVMMVRIPFSVPLWQELLSLALLYGTALLFVWLSGKIYRVGILMYGKKPTFKEMAKWLRYK